jgi:hypothetical protein
MSGAASPQRVITAPNEVVIRNSSLRDLIAIAYGVERWRVVGGPEWLDSPRYDLRALSKVPVSDPENLDLLALQAPVTSCWRRDSAWQSASISVARRPAEKFGLHPTRRR